MTNLTVFELYRAVDLLVGEVEPEGHSGIDEIRLKNLENLCSLTEHCLLRVRAAYRYRDRQEESMKRIADEAGYFLSETAKDLKRVIDIGGL